MFKTTFWRFSCTVIGALGCPLRDGDSGFGFYMGAGWCTVVEVKVHLAYLGGGDEVRLTCHGWLKLGLVINLIFVVIRLLV